MVHEESLAAVVGQLAAGEDTEGKRLRSPGLLRKHYSPRAKLLIWHGNLETLRKTISALGIPDECVHVMTLRQEPLEGTLTFGRVCRMPREPGAFAKAIYAEWHRSDEAGARVIVIEAVPDRPEWRAIADRLARAAG
jgi:L-threonylcarbamoyladenylate synthase